MNERKEGRGGGDLSISVKWHANDRQRILVVWDTCGEIGAERRIDQTISIDFSYRRDQIPRIYRRNAGVETGTVWCRNFFVVAAVVGIRSADRWIDDPVEPQIGTADRRSDASAMKCVYNNNNCYSIWFFTIETIFFSTFQSMQMSGWCNIDYWNIFLINSLSLLLILINFFDSLSLLLVSYLLRMR